MIEKISYLLYFVMRNNSKYVVLHRWHGLASYTFQSFDDLFRGHAQVDYFASFWKQPEYLYKEQRLKTEDIIGNPHDKADAMISSKNFIRFFTKMIWTK